MSPAPAPPGAIADLAFDPALAARLARGRGLLYGLSAHIRTIGALVMREALTRFGQSRIGYLWAIIEPAVFIALFIGLRTYISATVPIGESVALFVMSGIVVARLVIGMVQKVGAAIQANQQLLIYPLVQPLDTIVARCILETMTMIVVGALFFGGLLLVADNAAINDFVGFSEAAAAAIALSCSIGAFNAVFGTILPTWQRLWGFMSLPLFITSGAFFVPGTLPPAIVDVIWWNPVLHVVEWFRTAIYLDYHPVLEPLYPLGLSAGLLGAAVVLERVYRLRMANG